MRHRQVPGLPRAVHFLVCLIAIGSIACGGASSPTAPSAAGAAANAGPWTGNWIQVNFLTIYDGGVWSQDDLSGIGFVQSVTETEWVVTDNFGNGCAITFAYTVDGNRRFSRRANAARNGCPPGAENLTESGRLEFSSDNRFMIEHYDLGPGDELAAFKWMRR